ncbi:hypothetical protein CBS147317_9185 [Penicillium roqueforti]|nr:hypothetical protein CBS147372_9619 [Penicillium roqueforti]KAI3146404.1 hypothetical protein CBS147317_9185 [Penicillium roqueforti]
MVESQIPNRQKSLRAQKDKSASGSKNNAAKPDPSQDASLSSRTSFTSGTKRRKDRFKGKGKDEQGDKPDKKRKRDEQRTNPNGIPHGNCFKYGKPGHYTDTCKETKGDL